jgi:putative transcriptional regulator
MSERVVCYNVQYRSYYTLFIDLMCRMDNTMELGKMTPVAIAEELGVRLRQARLNADLTQAEVASRAGLNRRTVLNAEKGQVQLENLVAILASMDMVNQLNVFLPAQEISPIQLAKLKGRERQRASKSEMHAAPSKEAGSSW